MSFDPKVFLIFFLTKFISSIEYILSLFTYIGQELQLDVALVGDA